MEASSIDINTPRKCKTCMTYTCNRYELIPRLADEPITVFYICDTCNVATTHD